MNNQYSPNPFTIVATVLNNGTAPATNVALALNLPPGLSLTSGSLVQPIGNLPVGQEQQIVWTVQAAAQQSQTTLSFTVTATADQEESKQITRILTLPPLTVPAGEQPPRQTTSYYMSSTDINRAVQLGCDARVRGETGVVVLDFGSPVSWQTSASPLPQTRYGARLVRVGDIVGTDDVALAVLGFAAGYAEPYALWNNYTCSGLPANPTQLVAPKLSIATGVSNSALRDPRTRVWHDNADLNADHGAAWASILNTVSTLLRTTRMINGRPARLYPFVDVTAGYDSEYYQSPIGDTRDPRSGRRVNASRDADMWTTYPGTRDWAEGYDRVMTNPLRLPNYNFGSCESCPRTGSPSTWSPLVNGQRQSTPESQTLDRVYHLTWDLFTTHPLPQIYKAPYPNQWYNVRWYVNTIYSRNMTFAGVMTERAGSDTGRRSQFDCDPSGSPCRGDWVEFNCTLSSCPEFYPSQGWQALADTISASVTPYSAANTDIQPQTRLNWVTNIRGEP